MYEDYRRLYGTRRKGKDYKLIFRSCHLRLEGYDFAIRHRYEEELVFTISPTNLVTLHGHGESMTNRNLLSRGIGYTPIYSDMSAHRNKVHTIRLHTQGKSNPYAPGIQAQLNDKGEPTAFFNFPVDMTRAVTNEAKSAVKDETTKIRKLTRVMARMGVFDKIAHGRLGNWGMGRGVREDISKVNYKDPVGSDAEYLFCVGLGCCDFPNHSEYVNGVWTKVSEEQRLIIYRDRAVEAGLRALRKHIYSTKEGSYVHIPVQPKAHRQVP
jgi:hypothetical protein